MLRGISDLLSTVEYIYTVSWGKYFFLSVFTDCTRTSLPAGGSDDSGAADALAFRRETRDIFVCRALSRASPFAAAGVSSASLMSRYPSPEAAFRIVMEVCPVRIGGASEDTSCIPRSPGPRRGQHRSGPDRGLRRKDRTPRLPGRSNRHHHPTNHFSIEQMK